MSSDSLPLLRDAVGLDLADQIVRGGVSASQLADLSDTGNGGGVSVESKNDGYYRDSLYQTDGSAPLINPKYERFLDMYIDTGRMEVAYRACVSGNCSKESATQQASRLLKRVEVTARLKWLIKDRKRKAEGPVPGAGTDGRMTKDTKLEELERIIRTGTPSDRVRAIQEHNRLMAAGRPGAAHVPDPAFLADYMRRTAKDGKDPVALAKELRGEGVEAVGIEVPGGDQDLPEYPDELVSDGEENVSLPGGEEPA